MTKTRYQILRHKLLLLILFTKQSDFLALLSSILRRVFGISKDHLPYLADQKKKTNFCMQAVARELRAGSLVVEVAVGNEHVSDIVKNIEDRFYSPIVMVSIPRRIFLPPASFEKLHNASSKIPMHYLNNYYSCVISLLCHLQMFLESSRCNIAIMGSRKHQNSALTLI